MEKRKVENISEEIKLVSFANCNAYEETTFGEQFFTPLDLTEMVVITHNELENQKNKFKIN